MAFTTIVDRILRTIAGITAFASLWIVLIVGIMANDASTPAGARASAIILLGGLGLVVWILLCSFRPVMIAGWLPPWPALRFILVKLPCYTSGVAGIAWCLNYGYMRYRVANREAVTVKRGEIAYPISNPSPVHELEIAGSLPASVPIGDFEATYATDVTDDSSAGPCQRLDDLEPKQLRLAQALQTKEIVPLVRTGSRYRAVVVVDRFLPGRCNWHLRTIQYRMYVQGYGYSKMYVAGAIQFIDEQHRALDAARGEKFYTGRIDIWCGEARNKAVTGYYPELCYSWDAWRLRIPRDQQAIIPNEEKGAQESVFAFSDTALVSFNFHDADAPIVQGAF